MISFLQLYRKLGAIFCFGETLKFVHFVSRIFRRYRDIWTRAEIYLPHLLKVFLLDQGFEVFESQLVLVDADLVHDCMGNVFFHFQPFVLALVAGVGGNKGARSLILATLWRATSTITLVESFEELHVVNIAFLLASVKVSECVG